MADYFNNTIWQLKPQARAMGVGPGRSSMDWWANSAEDVVIRAALFDDTIVFNADGNFQNIMGDETWVEAWQDEGHAEGNRAPAIPHDGSNAATWNYNSSAGTLTITGVGAHIGIPKVVNGLEINDPINAPESITYNVIEISDDEVIFDISIGFAWWRFIYFKMAPDPATTPICFPKGTPITTEQGLVAIEKLNTDKHTIRGKEIVAITQSRPLQQHIVCFEKDALSKNVPSQQTLCSMEHKVFYKGEMTKARNLVDLCENVTFVPYNGEILYNVLLKKHDKMMINNLICETLHPENIAAKISQMKDGQKKNKAIQELTKIIKENNVPEYQKLYASL